MFDPSNLVRIFVYLRREFIIIMLNNQFFRPNIIFNRSAKSWFVNVHVWILLCSILTMDINRKVCVFVEVLITGHRFQLCKFVSQIGSNLNYIHTPFQKNKYIYIYTLIYRGLKFKLYIHINLSWAQF